MFCVSGIGIILSRVMLNCDLRARFVDQYLTLMIDFFSYTPMGADTYIKSNLPQTFCIHVSHFDFHVIL